MASPFCVPEGAAEEIVQLDTILILRKGHVAYIAIDIRDEHFNIINEAFVGDLDTAVAAVHEWCDRHGLGACVIVSRKENGFVVGADIKLQVRTKKGGPR